MTSVLAIVSQSVFKSMATTPISPGDLVATDRYTSTHKTFESLGDTGAIFLVTVRPPNEELWLVGIIEQPTFKQNAWIGKPNQTRIVDVTSAIPRLTFVGGQGIKTAKGKLGMSLQTPRLLTAEDEALLRGLAAPQATRPREAAPGADTFPPTIEKQILAFLKHRLEDTGVCYLTLEHYRPLLDPRSTREQAETKISNIDNDLFDQGVAANELAQSSAVFVEMLKDPRCRAPARMLRSLYTYLVDNSEQDHEGTFPLQVGFDTRHPRFAAFSKYAFLKSLPKAIAVGIPTYLELLDHAEPEVRGWAAAILSCHLTGDENAGKLLLAHALKEKDPGVAASLVIATSLQLRYHGFKTEDIHEQLARFLDDPRIGVAAAATIALLHQAPQTATGASQKLCVLFQKKPPLTTTDTAYFTLDERSLKLAAAEAIPAGCPHDEEWLDAVIGLLDCSLEVGTNTVRPKVVGRLVALGAASTLELTKQGTLSERQRKLAEALLAHPAAWSPDLDNRIGTKSALQKRIGTGTPGAKPNPTKQTSAKPTRAKPTRAKPTWTKPTDEADAGQNCADLKELRGTVKEKGNIFPSAQVLARRQDTAHLIPVLEEYFLPDEPEMETYRGSCPRLCPWNNGKCSDKEQERRFIRFIELGTELMVEKGKIVPLIKQQFLLPVPSQDYWRFHLVLASLFALSRLKAPGIRIPDGVEDYCDSVAGIIDFVADLRRLLTQVPTTDRMRFIENVDAEDSVLYLDRIDPKKIPGFLLENGVDADDAYFPNLLSGLARQKRHPERDRIIRALVEVQKDNADDYGPQGQLKHAKPTTLVLSDGTKVTVRLVHQDPSRVFLG